jgi:hypothetical protein
VESVSPSFTTSVLPSVSKSKLADHLLGFGIADNLNLGQRRTSSDSAAQWSGSMWFTTT